MLTLALPGRGERVSDVSVASVSRGHGHDTDVEWWRGGRAPVGGEPKGGYSAEVAAPWIACQTFIGVHGMSMWRTPR